MMMKAKLASLVAGVMLLAGCSSPQSFTGYVHAECDPTTAEKVTVCRATEMPVPTVTVTAPGGASPTPTPTSTAPVTTVKVNDTAFTYTGTWATSTNAVLYNGDNHFSNGTGNTWSYSFNGSKIEWYGEKNTALGIVGVKLDDLPEVMVDPYNAGGRLEQQLLYTSPANLAEGAHKITVRITGTKNAASTGTYASADRVDVTGTSNPSPSPSPTATQTNPPTASGVPQFNKIVTVIFENHSYNEIIGNGTAPYMNSLAKSGANLTNAYAMARPSQPNYLHQFSGSAWGVTDNNVPYNPPRNWTTENLAHQLFAKGKTFRSYAEGLPSPGYIGPATNGYEPKHVPSVNWANYDQTFVGRPLSDFPKDFNTLPDVSFVVGNRCNSMHDCSIQTGDTWLKNTVDGYLQWAKANNSLLMVTFDEGALSDSSNHIYTTLNGANVKAGNFTDNVTIHSTLGLMQDAKGLARTEGSVGKASMAGAFTSTDPAPVPTETTPPPAPAPADTTQAAVTQNWGAVVRGDEFNYTGAPDASKWGVYVSAGHAGNGQRTAAAWQGDGQVMRVTGDANGNTGGMAGKYNWGSSKLRVETRMRTNARDPEYHPVLILWPDANWTATNCPEIDYMESMKDPTHMGFNLHYPACGSGNWHEIQNFDTTQWHNYAVEWVPGQGVKGWIDGVLWFEDTGAAAKAINQGMHDTIQLDWFPQDSAATNPQPSWMEIDWTRTYN